MEVGDVIQFYDSDKRFPAWGFGARAYSGTVSHCFNLAGSPGAVEVFVNQLCYLEMSVVSYFICYISPILFICHLGIKRLVQKYFTF